MALDKLRAALAAIARTLDTRVSIVRIVVDPKGRELRRIHRGSFTAPRDSRIGEPHSKESNYE